MLKKKVWTTVYESSKYDLCKGGKGVISVTFSSVIGRIVNKSDVEFSKLSETFIIKYFYVHTNKVCL